MAIPLSMVARLEEFPRSALEQAGDLDVVQYRDQILPLIHLAKVLPTSRSYHGGAEEESDTIHVIVYSDGKRNAGLVVDRILDIVEETIKVRLPSGRHGVQCSAVIQGRVTDLLHMEGIIRSAHPGFFDHGDSAKAMD